MRVADQAAQIALGECGQPPWIETLEGGLESLSLAFDHLPDEPGLEDVFGHPGQPAVPGNLAQLGRGFDLGPFSLQRPIATLAFRRTFPEGLEGFHGGSFLF